MNNEEKKDSGLKTVAKIGILTIPAKLIWELAKAINKKNQKK